MDRYSGSAGTNSGKPAFCIGIGLSDTVWYRNSTQAEGISSPAITPGAKYTVNVYKNNMTINEDNYNSTMQLLTARQGYSSYLFARHQPEGAYCTMIGKIYDCKIYDNGKLVRDFIPCYRKSDGEIGFYDLINEQFYINAGIGVFGKGPDVY